jgi:hypothetical protein
MLVYAGMQAVAVSWKKTAVHSRTTNSIEGECGQAGLPTNSVFLLGPATLRPMGQKSPLFCLIGRDAPGSFGFSGCFLKLGRPMAEYGRV